MTELSELMEKKPDVASLSPPEIDKIMRVVEADPLGKMFKKMWDSGIECGFKDGLTKGFILGIIVALLATIILYSIA